MTPEGFTLFDTPIGRCGIAWTARGVSCLQLPEARERDTRARLRQRVPQACDAPPPPSVQRAIGRIAALLAGRSADLSAVPLDLDGLPPFHQRVYEAARLIPPGSTMTYGAIAARLGAPGAARAVGQALARNPIALVVPCHRVLGAAGQLGGFSANGGVATKQRLLAIEGVRVNGTPALFDGRGQLAFDPDAALAHVRAADPVLARLIDRVGPFRLRPERGRSLLAALAEAIVYQQLTARAAGTIFTRLSALFPGGRRGLTAERLLTAPDEALRGAGLSQSKVLSLRDLARRAAAGDIPTLRDLERMDDEAIVDRLVAVRGIGRWTVEMLLIFRLGRPDVLPLDDLGIRKGYAAAFRLRDLPARHTLEARGARWTPYRTVASWYLWRAAEGRGG